MKTYIGVFILVMLLAAASGCTSQQAKPAVTVTTVAATAAPTAVPTVVTTPQPMTTPTEGAATTAAPEVSSATVIPTATPWSSATFSSTRKLVIHIKGNMYTPDSLTILPGTMVTWVNDDANTHVVKATGDAAGKFTSQELISGAQFNYDFGEALGTFEFTDPKYPDMKGAIIVRKGETLYEAGLPRTTTTAP